MRVTRAKVSLFSSISRDRKPLTMHHTHSVFFVS
uniref:Uncharacterized protein n=1 Tax=Arundo donax TaxID=35708 RepID=A0A0A8YAW5_ARUDO